MQTNPTYVGSSPPLMQHPFVDSTGQRLIKGYLQHAPYPFRTLTGPQGALAYVKREFATYTTLPQKTLTPAVTHVVIHCMPGLYGPTSPTAIDPVSGLPCNGEPFPAVIDLARVSLQGASALDTVFDARGQETHNLQLSRPDIESDDRWQDFIDGIAFRNARAGLAPGSGAAIWIRGLNIGAQFVTPVYTAITNCFFQGNDVGIAVDASGYVQGSTVLYATHGTLIFNNTFAWNTIGIWQGNTGDLLPITYNHLSGIANNIFDIASPPEFPSGLSCFEGVSSYEREVRRRGSVNLLDPFTGFGPDFNAFSDARAAGGTVCFNN